MTHETENQYQLADVLITHYNVTYLTAAQAEYLPHKDS